MMTDTKHNASKAVIYCRVSSTKQTTKGTGLDSQEARCREYAGYKGYEIAEVFKDDVSGGLIDRPGMQAMLGFLRRKRSQTHVVIIDDISRLARSIEAHLQLRSAISKVGAVLESPSVEFGEDSDSILVENLLASVSQHQRQKNGEQTKNRMRGRVMNGYWVFQAPIGYRYERVQGHGKLLVRDEPHASIIAEAIEGFATGRLQTQVEVKRFLEAHPHYPGDLHQNPIHQTRIQQLLTRPVYAGYIEAPNWNIGLRKGHHEAVVSLETFERVQDRLAGNANAPARKDLNADFPLRGFVACGDCGRPLTAGWSKGRSKHYPYYQCAHKGCVSYGRSIKRDEIEGEFAALLAQAQPSKKLFALVKEMFRDLWAHRLGQSAALTRSMKDEVKSIDQKITDLLDRIVEADSDTLITAYERRVKELERRKMLLAEKISTNRQPSRHYRSSFRTALEYLSNPLKLWFSDRLEDKRAVLKLTFADRLAYVRGQGFRTADLTLPFKVLEQITGGKNRMVGPEGFEPPTKPL